MSFNIRKYIHVIGRIKVKRRNGMTGKAKLTFHRNYTSFDNYINVEEPEVG